EPALDDVVESHRKRRGLGRVPPGHLPRAAVLDDGPNRVEAEGHAETPEALHGRASGIGNDLRSGRAWGFQCRVGRGIHWLVSSAIRSSSPFGWIGRALNPPGRFGGPFGGTRQARGGG